jgi:hypothetical protein
MSLLTADMLHDLGGTISSGTMLISDIIPALLDRLEMIEDRLSVGKPGQHSALTKEWDTVRREMSAGLEMSELCDDITDAINSYLPGGWYCGIHEGDGALWGIWREYDEYELADGDSYDDNDIIDDVIDDDDIV